MALGAIGFSSDLRSRIRRRRIKLNKSPAVRAAVPPSKPHLLTATHPPVHPRCTHPKSPTAEPDLGNSLSASLSPTRPHEPPTDTIAPPNARPSSRTRLLVTLKSGTTTSVSSIVKASTVSQDDGAMGDLAKECRHGFSKIYLVHTHGNA